MTLFEDADQFYACMRALFARIEEEEPTAGDAVWASRLVIRLRCTAPAAEITLNGRQRPVQVRYGPTNLRSDLDIELAADTLHRILLGELSLKKALANGRLKVRGPAWKTFALADLFRRGQAIYPQVLREQKLISGQVKSDTSKSAARRRPDGPEALLKR